jgi:hypothetical protein
VPLAPNLGECPPHAKGKRVRVVLRNGMRPAGSWPADGRDGCNWRLTGSGFDIKEWEIVG